MTNALDAVRNTNLAGAVNALKLLEIFREEQQSLALVVDEYGEVTGMVTVNDLMGAVVGRLHRAVLTRDADDIVRPFDDPAVETAARKLVEMKEYHAAISASKEMMNIWPRVAGAKELNEWKRNKKTSV